MKIKEKCKTFPYCNQGDINALELTENKTIKKAIKEISKKTGKDKTHIKNLVAKEIEEIITAFLESEFEGGRHERRVKKIPKQ